MMEILIPYLAFLFLGECMLIFLCALTCAFCQAVAEWWRERKKKKGRP